MGPERERGVEVWTVWLFLWFNFDFSYFYGLILTSVNEGIMVTFDVI